MPGAAGHSRPFTVPPFTVPPFTVPPFDVRAGGAAPDWTTCDSRSPTRPHAELAALPFRERLEDWDLDGMHGVLGLHRHVVRLIELDDVSYVIKELPDALVEREYRLLRALADDGLPTAEVVAALTGKPDDVDGMLITRHLDYSLPYRTLLAGRGLTIPYLGERMLDALVGLLVRLHLAGFYWGDCSLSNTLFRRDAGALSAYVIDLETGERYPSLTAGQRQLDLNIATENVAGGLLDLQMGGRLAADIDPWEVSTQIEERYTLAVDRVDRAGRVRRRRDLPDRAAAATTPPVGLRRRGDGDRRVTRRRAAPVHPTRRGARVPLGAAQEPDRARDDREPGPPPARRHQGLRHGTAAAARRATAPAPASPCGRCRRTWWRCAGSTSGSNR